MSVDRLSALPDGILCHILSFLEMKEAAISCLLSKRWQFLWTELPGLRFATDFHSKMFVSRVNRTLAICSRHNLERFEVDFKKLYEERCLVDVYVWIRFAVKYKVKEFTLLLYNGYSAYTPPEMMYSNPCWTSLTVAGFIMAPRGTIQWRSLTTLWIEHVTLDERAFEKIFSGCPVLSRLDLVLCKGFNRSEADSRTLRRLAITDWEGGGATLNISAPCIHTFSINLGRYYRKLRFENFESLVRAEISIEDIDEWNDIQYWNRETLRLWKERIKQLLGSIRHVKMLRMDRGTIQVLSLIARYWQLPQSMTRFLEIHVTRDKKSISGLALILESSPNLETLVIHGCECYDDCECYSFAAFRSNLASKDDLDGNLSHLKTVCFKNFGDPSRDNGEPILTLARILLKKAVVLEKMVVNCQGFTATSSTTIYEMNQKLLSYPRSSQKEVVLLC